MRDRIDADEREREPPGGTAGLPPLHASAIRVGVGGTSTTSSANCRSPHKAPTKALAANAPSTSALLHLPLLGATTSSAGGNRESDRDTDHPAAALEERQSRQMRSFLHNFLADDRGRFHELLDLERHALDAGVAVTDATLEELARALPELRGLRLNGCAAITDVGLGALARRCGRLGTLLLGGCVRLTDLGLRLVAHNCPLVAVDLSDCPQVTDAVLQTLAAGAWRLETLILQRCPRVTDSGLARVAQCCRGLRHLDVSECEHVGEFGDQALLELGRQCPELRVLDLFGCRHVHDAGVRAVAHGCPRLTTLRLTGCTGVRSTGLRALARRCRGLEVLSLAGCGQTTNDDLTELARHSPALRWLDISGSPNVDATGIGALAHHCHQLAELTVSGCGRLDDAALGALAGGIGSRAGLRRLALADCPRVTEAGVEALCLACPNLLTLDLTDCPRIGRRFLQRLIQRLEFVEWATGFFGFQPLPNAAELCVARDRRLRENASAVQIQALMRGCLARGGVYQAKLRYVERRVLPRIQARVRGFLARRWLAAERQRGLERRAAGIIAQSYQDYRLRDRLARHRRLLRIQRDQDTAATIFQKVFRGHRDRQFVRRLREAERRQRQLEARIQTMLELAAIKVQRAYRGHRGRADAALLRATREANRLQAERERQAAGFLQRVYRGHRGRRDRAARVAELLRQKQAHDGAVTMQKVFRGHRARRHARLLREEAAVLRRINAALTIQRHWRGLKDKHLAAVLLGLIKLRAREDEAARRIQAVYRLHTSRGFLRAMRLARELQRRRVRGATTFQRLYRGHRGRTEAEVQRELAKLEVLARPLFDKATRLSALAQELGDQVASLERKLRADEDDETQLTLDLEKTMQIKTKYHDSSRITGTPQRYLTQYLQVQLADQLRAKRVELAVAHRAHEALVGQWRDAQRQLRGVQRELEPLTEGVVRQTRELRTRRLQTKVRRERVAATRIQKVFRGYRVRCAVREGANCWIRVDDGRVYYYNTFTGESRWQRPLAMSLFQDDFLRPLPNGDSIGGDLVVAAEAGPDGGSTTKPTVTAAAPASNWYEAFDDRLGQTYFYNLVTKEYVWSRPEDLAAGAGVSDSQSARRRRAWLEQQQEDGLELELLGSSELRGRLGEWEQRRDPLSELDFFYHPPSGNFRTSLSPRTIHATLSTSSAAVTASARSTARRSARSVPTSARRPVLWQYRYGYEYDADGQLVAAGGGERPIWTEHIDETNGQTYYYNHVTDEYRWERPSDFGLAFVAYTETPNASREWFASQQEPSTAGAPQSGALSTRGTPRRALGRKWLELVDPETQHTYYYNEVTGETRWSLSPRSARDTADTPGDIPLALFAEVKRLRESPVPYSARVTHMTWLEAAMVERDWAKVDVLVQQIALREQSQALDDRNAAASHAQGLSPDDDWSVYTDPGSGGLYYYNARTGETRWA